MIKTIILLFFCFCISHTAFSQKENTDNLIASVADEICQYYTSTKISDTSNWEKKLGRAVFLIATDNNPSVIRLQHHIPSDSSACNSLLTLQEKIVRRFHLTCPAAKYIPENEISRFCTQHFHQKKIIDTINDGTLYNYFPMLNWIIDSLKKQTTQNLYFFFDNHNEGKKYKTTFDTISDLLIKNKKSDVLILYSLINRDSSLHTQYGLAISLLQSSDSGELLCLGQLQLYFYYTYTTYKIADCRWRNENEISAQEVKNLIPPPPPPPPPPPSKTLLGR